MFFMRIILIYFDQITDKFYFWEESIEKIEKQIYNITNPEIKERLENLKKEKEDLFRYYNRNHTYRRAAAYLFDSFKKNSKVNIFDEKVKDLKDLLRNM